MHFVLLSACQSVSYHLYHQPGRLVSESACERKDPGSNPAADMVDAARKTAWDLGKQPNNYRSNYPTQEWARRAPLLLLQELLNTSLTTILYLIAVIVQFCSIDRSYGRNITAGVFGVFNMLAYTVGSFYLYRDWKDSHPNSSFSGSVLKRNP
ncbi:hypothetical protein FHG87_018207 [Trinorchestia longiramus]|nr:hypothetical protein FHG87_018207 [Trinorchestia longiramus]